MKVAFGPRYLVRGSLLLLVSAMLSKAAMASSGVDPKLLLSQGKVNEALAAYDTLIAEDSSNYMNYYMRATTYLSMGRTVNALRDLDRVIAMRPEFDQAYLNRGKLYLRDGFYDRAVSDFEFCLQHASGGATSEIEKMLSDARKLKKLWVEAERHGTNAARCDLAVAELNQIIETSPTFTQARILRGQCHLRQNQIDFAILDYTRAASFVADSSDQNYMLSKLYLVKGDRAKASEQVAQCLHLSPESKTCFKLFKQIKALNKSLVSMQQEVASSPSKAQHLIATYMKDVENANKEYPEASFPKLFAIYEEEAWKGMCSVYVKASNGPEAVKWCAKALAKDEDDVELLILAAEANIITEDYEAAIRHYEKGAKFDSSNKRIVEGLEKARALLKRSKQRDYYKVLGISRTATDQEIRRAYRKLAVQWHPDKHSSDINPEVAQKKMQDINQAYDVLKDAKTRAQYDQGVDPNDPQSGFPGGGGQFSQDQIFQIFQQFGGGGFGGAQFHHQGHGGGGGGYGGHNHGHGNNRGHGGGGGQYYGGGHKFEFDL